MARSNKVPFRREYTITSNGFVGDSNGWFVGDILSLHVDVLNGSSSYLVEGKVGLGGQWETLEKGTAQRHLPTIDISSTEYVRIQLFNITTSTKVIIFGYNSAPNGVIQETKQTDRDFSQSILSTCYLADIKEELQKLNRYLSIITEEEL